MGQYFPYGKKVIPTEAQIEQQEFIFKQYDYYGIPYGDFDKSNDGEGYATQKEIDRDTARLFILKGEIIPRELEDALLKYKQEDIES